MKRGKGIRIVAGFMAFTLFLTSCFFIAFESDVFGASNKDVAINPNPYVDESTAHKLTVVERGKSGEDDADIVVSNEGNNTKGSKPLYNYQSWNPNEYISESSTVELPVVPGTNGTKGTKGNPFIVLEVVPDKAMQELTYYTGSQESGLPFDPAYFSAKFMMDYYQNNGSGWRFTNDNFKVGSNSGDMTNFITSLNNKLNEKYSNWVSLHEYDIVNFESDTSNTNLYMKIFDCSNTADNSTKNGSYDFNELYNLDITTDDLLDNKNAVPTKSEGKSDYSYVETSNGTTTTKYYTDDLIFLAKAVTGDSLPTKSDVENFIVNTINNVHLSYKQVKSTNKSSDATAPVVPRNTDVKKYNLKDFVQGSNQDITAQDMSDSGEFDYYDISQGYIGRGAQYTTKHNKLNISNYWKIRFRKYYVDHFEDLYNQFKTYDDQIHSDRNNANNSTLINNRNDVLKQLLREYEPLFKRKGVQSSIALQDVNDWEVTSSNTVSTQKVFKPEAKGGYILAVKPGMGDMYILKRAEVTALMSQMTDKEISASGISADSILYTRESTRFDTGEARNHNDLRWIYVPARWALEGDSRASLDNTYRSGYLDDKTFTNGFASKSFININNYWLSIYDRYNRKFHGTSGNRDGYINRYRDYTRFGYDEVSYKMLEKTNSISEKKNYDKVHDDESSHYFSFSNQTFYDTRSNQMYYSWQRQGDDKEQNIYAIDDYHLNILQEMKNDLGLTDDQISYIKTNNNLINGTNSGDDNWKAFFADSNGSYIQSNFLFNRSGNKAITGLALNFNTEDTYSYKSVEDSKLSAARKELETHRYVPGYGNTEWGVYENSDEITTVSSSQHVAETAKKYSFTYYGFKANPVLQRSLFEFDNIKDFNNFYFKVICVTPAEINQVSAIAKQLNQGVVGKKENVKLDLVERADMFYIHTHKNKSQGQPDNVEAAYRLYRDMVLQDDSLPVPTYAGLTTFYDNDLEWDQVMKIWKRSSFAYGARLPIMFNQYVEIMAEESSDDTSNTGCGQEDTHMYLYANQDAGKDKYSGNINNIAKLFQVLIQFNFRIKKASAIPRTEDEISAGVDSRKILRTFMTDIYSGIGEVRISDSYRASSRVENSAQYTGYIKAVEDADTEDFYLRKLCVTHDSLNTQFKRNALYLWNMYTFYPYKSGNALRDDRLSFLEQGYLENYYYSDNERSLETTSDTQSTQYHYSILKSDMTDQSQSVRRRVGSNGIDGENVYVLHPNPYGQYDNSNGAGGLMSSLSNGSPKGSSGVDTFFSRAFLIMRTQATKPVFRIEPYGNGKGKSYTIIKVGDNSSNFDGNDESIEETNKGVKSTDDNDEIMFDYYTKSTIADCYSNDEMKKDLNLYLSVDNLTSDFVSVFDVYLKNSKNKSIKRSTPDILNKQMKPFEASGYLTDWDWIESDYTAQVDDVIESNYKGVMQTEGLSLEVRNQILLYNLSQKKAQGLMVVSADVQEKQFFYIPYTLGDFYNEYNQAVVWYLYWYRDDKTHQLYPVVDKHVVNILERQLFALE